jgi:hypothetical protein
MDVPLEVQDSMKRNKVSNKQIIALCPMPLSSPPPTHRFLLPSLHPQHPFNLFNFILYLSSKHFQLAERALLSAAAAAAAGTKHQPQHSSSHCSKAAHETATAAAAAAAGGQEQVGK